MLLGIGLKIASAFVFTLMSAGVKVAFTQLGIIVALTFIGIPFVVRTVQPVLEELDTDVEEAAALLGSATVRR